MCTGRVGLINCIGDVFNDPQVIHRGMRLGLGGVSGVASPIVINGARMSADTPSPKLGDSNR